jgi:hypothetical protein
VEAEMNVDFSNIHRIPEEAAVSNDSALARFP